MRPNIHRDELAESFQVDAWVHFLGGFVCRHPGMWKWLGNLETGLLSDTMTDTDIHQPVYVTGLARAGTTLLLEILDRHPDTAAHRYQDYPLLFTPYLWNRYLERTPRSKAVLKERTHGDGVFISPESPEAFEEILWMAFFNGPHELHDPARPAVLTADTQNPVFEKFYQDHIRKLLLVRGGRRYLAKGNYNITRLAYLLRLFPDARFVIPVREPVRHIASLVKQHRRFCRGQQVSPRALTHLKRIGHFEFGLDRRPINPGDLDGVNHIIDLWVKGAEVEGWAVYWALIHNRLADDLTDDPRLREAVHLVGYDYLCRDPADAVSALFEHCRLASDDMLMGEITAMIRPPSLSEPEIFSDRDLEIIERCTAASFHRLGSFDRKLKPEVKTGS